MARWPTFARYIRTTDELGEMVGESLADKYLTRARGMLEFAARMEEQELREFLADCAADFMLLAAEQESWFVESFFA